MKRMMFLGVVAVLGVVAGTPAGGIAECEDLIVEQLTDSNTNNTNLKVSGPRAVWQEEDPNGGDWEIFYYDGNAVSRLTNNETDDVKPQIRGKKVVWQGRDTNEGDWEIFLYKRRCVQQVTNNDVNDQNPNISDQRIFWQQRDGDGWQIVTAAIAVEVEMKVAPETINLKSKGQSITVKLFPGGSGKARDVVVSSLRLQDTVAAEGAWVSEGLNMLTIKFDRPAVQSLLSVGTDVEITLTGRLKDGTVITATDTVKVIKPGH